MVVASRWVHQITSIALEMALPAGAGYWLDRRWGTSPWLVVLGACLGFVISGMSLAQMVKRLTPPAKPQDSSVRAKTTDNSGPSSQ
jgi:F0F1-type ATP synthase assembly protein I